MKNSQEVAMIIKETAKSKKITIGKMLSDCGLSINTLSTMQAGGSYPRMETIVKIAEYLDCSVDYLLGRTDNPNGYSISNIDTTINGTQAHIINNNVSDNDLYDIKNSLGQLSKTDKHRAIADILDLLEKKYEKKAL